MKVIAFDLDGVLADTEQIHHSALLDAISIHISVNKDAVLSILSIDGSTTASKLSRLQLLCGLTDSEICAIDKTKQIITQKQLTKIRPSASQREILSVLSEKYRLALVSNSRQANVDQILTALNIKQFFQCVLTPNPLSPKPDPAMYIHLRSEFNVSSKDILVLEDSEAGIESALKSGCFVMGINTMTDVSLTNIQNVLQEIDTYNNSTNGWERQQIFSRGIHTD